MTRPPKARPPPPPSTVRTNDTLRRQHQHRSTSHHSGDGKSSPMGMFHPVSPSPVPRSDSRASTAISRLSNSSSARMDEPDNTSIIRGAQILRQQFIERSRTVAAHNRNMKKKKKNSQNRPGTSTSNNKVTPVPARLFPSKGNEDVLQDLLGIQPLRLSPPGSPNDVMSFSGQQDLTTDSWNARGSAFDPASKRSSPNDKRETIMYGDIRHHNDMGIQDLGFAPHTTTTTTHPNDFRRVQEQQQRSPSSSLPRAPPGRGENGANARPPPQLPKPPQDPPPIHHQSHVPASSSPAFSSSIGWPVDSAFPSSVVRDEHNLSPWMSLDSSSKITGPDLPEQTGGGKMLDTSVNTSLSEDFAALERTAPSHPHLQQHHQQQPYNPFGDDRKTRLADMQAFEDFIDSVSLDDKAFDDLVESKHEEEKDQSMLQRKSWHPWSDNSNKGFVGQQQPDDAIVRSRSSWETPPSIKKERSAVTSEEPQRSYSSTAFDPQRAPPQRALSMGQIVRRSQHRARKRRPQRQTSLRDDLLCGMESNCKTDFHPQGDHRVRSELVEDSCACEEDDAKRYMQYITRARRNGLNGVGSGRPRRNRQPSPSDIPSFSSSLNVALSEEDRFDILAPASDEYMSLHSNDAAFQHAVNAGALWQALVGNHVRFPKHWWQGRYRTAPLGCHKNMTGGKNKWVYYDRHRIRGNTCLNRYVKKRDEPGQILLHLVVRDFMTSTPILDIAIGCFHPNAKSIRPAATPNKRLEDCRDVWMATRFRNQDVISVIDCTFLSERIGQPKKTPLGDSKRKISNTNVRAVFGESPPIRTVFALESDIYEELSSGDGIQDNGPADVLLQKYVYRTL